jgi:diaminopimelate decarboxylase
VADYVAAIRRGLEGYRGRIVLEPGRHLVAEAGVLVTRVIRVKHGQERDFLVLDAAMNDLMRPALYDAWHDMHPLHAEPRPLQRYDVVGPVCETGDTFARDRQLPRCEAGDLLLIAGAGAYGASMGSNYNSRPLPAEVLLDGGRYAVVRRRQSFEQMLAGEQLPQAWHAA